MVDTTVWSLAFRRDEVPDVPHVRLLARALQGQIQVMITGIILQEVLQGVLGPKQAQAITDRLSVLPMVVPDRQDHIDAAEIGKTCRKAGVQLKTVDALIAQLCIRHDLELLTTDQDFVFAARHVPLKLAMPK